MVQDDELSTKTENLNCRVKPGLKQDVEQTSSQLGKSASEWIRQTLQESVSGTTDPNKGPDMFIENPEPSAGSEGTGNSQDIDKSDPNAGGSYTESGSVTGENYQTE